MPYLCPACQHGSLRITSRIELPPDSRSDEITLQLVTCGNCGFRGVAIYEESRRGALDSESVDHRCHPIDAAAWARLRRLMQSCGNRDDPRCDCEAHRRLGRRDASGRWSGLDDVQLGARYAMERG